jgi:hypothetical protein
MGINHGSFKDGSKSEGLLAGSGDIQAFWTGLSVLLNGKRHANVNKKYCEPIVSMHIKTNNEGKLALCKERPCMRAEPRSDTS